MLILLVATELVADVMLSSASDETPSSSSGYEAQNPHTAAKGFD